MSQPVLREQHDSWIELVLNNPERRNALTLEMAQGLAEAIEEMNQDGTTKVVILRGADSIFSSGLDLKSIQPQNGVPSNFAQLWERVHRGLANSNLIWICALERYAINGASSLAIAADWLVCGEGAFLQIGEIKLGMAAPRNMDWLAQRHSEAVAARLCLLGDRVPAAELHRLGIATEVVSDDAVLARCRNLAVTMSEYPMSGIVGIKSGMRKAFAGRSSGSVVAHVAQGSPA